MTVTFYQKIVPLWCNFVSYGNFIILFKYSKLVVSYRGASIEDRPKA